ncbi:MAG: hypothetical protein K940chlam5_00956 [Candidatus Anoxychlamydiales bacterium]|nr:hypothetical protein [Candidatus Anoxychlamydiales bacterium]
MKKIALLFLTAAVLFGLNSCEEPPKKKEYKKTDRHYRDRYRGREDRNNHQEKRW